MKITEAEDEEGVTLFFDIRTDNGTRIGSSSPNDHPINGDNKITLIDCKKYATLWAASDDLLQALEDCKVTLKAFLPEAFKTISNAEAAINKARGL